MRSVECFVATETGLGAWDGSSVAQVWREDGMVVA